MSNIPESEAATLNLENIQTNYYAYAAITLYTYHYATTFPQEIQVVWGRRFTGVSLLLMLNRYLPFVNMILQLLGTSPSPALNSHNGCLQQAVWTAVVTCIEEITIDLLSALRVYAIWGRSWKCFLSVSILGLANLTGTLLLRIPSTVYSLSPVVYGCRYSQFPFISTVLRERAMSLLSISSVIARDLLVLILTWVRTYEIRKLAAGADIKLRLSTLLLRDGTIYFGVILVFDMTLLLTDTNINFPEALSSGFEYIEFVLQPMLLSHLMFDLREAYLHSVSTNDTGTASQRTGIFRHLSSVHFAARIVGNIGAPLVEDWFDDVDAEQQPPPPVACDDPFAYGVLDLKDGEAFAMGQIRQTALPASPGPNS